MIENIVSNLIGALIWLVLGIVLAIACYLVWVLPKYKKLTQFFGISTKHPRLRVYFSRLNIPVGGSVDAQGTPRSYSGVAIPEYEFGIMESLLQPFLMLQPRWMPEAFVKRLRTWGLLTVPDIIFEASPSKEQDIKSDNLALVGSQAYNEGTKYYLSRGNPYLTLVFDNQGPAVIVARGKSKGEKITTDTDLAILLRIKDDEHGTNVFVGAGLGVNGTRAAIEYLANNWEALEKNYGAQEFGLCIKCPWVQEDAEGFRKPDILRRLPF